MKERQESMPTNFSDGEADDPFDVVVAGGRLVTPTGQFEAAVGIKDGRIAALLAPRSKWRARETIDATGHIVLPGAVDAHVHCREPGLVHKEGFAAATRAAAAGGVTTILVMPTDQPWTLTSDDFEAKRDMLDGSAHVDVGLQAAIAGDISNHNEIEALASAGAVSFEIFLGDLPPAYVVADNGRLRDVLTRIAAVDVVAGISPADDSLVAAALALVEAEGGRDLATFFRSRPPESEAIGVARACLLAEATGARVHLRQMSARSAIAVLRDFRRRVPGLSAEVTPHNLLLTADDALPLGPFGKVLPPLRTAADLDAAWHGLDDGTIDIVATDHAPHLPEEKEVGSDDIWKGPGGFPGVQTLLPLMLDAAASGRITYESVVRLLSEAPARLFGIFPQKGAIAIGSDADLVLVDPGVNWTIRNQDQHSRARVTPFAERLVRGAPTVTLLRGTVVMRNREPVGTPSGRFVSPARS